MGITQNKKNSLQRGSNLSLINQLINQKVPDSINVGTSLFGGSAGELFLQVIYGLQKKKRADLNLIYCKLEGILNAVKNGEVSLSATFGEGLSGFGWLLLYMNKLDMIELPNFFFEDLDAFLFTEMKTMFLANNWDLINGALGPALYFIKRGDTEKVKVAFDYLFSNRIEGGGEVKWSRLDNMVKDVRFIDYGLAHGNAGILYFLSKCYESNIYKAQCRELITGCLNFYKSSRQEILNVGSYWPNVEELAEHTGVAKGESSRLAWCYGDLGALFSLYRCANIIGNDDMKICFHEMLLKTAERRTFSSTKISDPYLCHGSSGVAIMYRCLYEMSGEQLFNKAYLYWKKETAKMISKHLKGSGDDFKDSMLKYLSHSKKDLLDGNGGLALFLITQTLESLDALDGTGDWKEIVFLK